MADLHGFLSRFAVDSAVATLADTLCAAGGASLGWCGVDMALRLRTNGKGNFQLWLDGKPLRRAAQARLGDRQARWLGATIEGRHVIGSPIDLVAVRRIEGVVAATAHGGLTGWCWHPAAPELRPRLELHDADGRRRAVKLSDPEASPLGLFARHRPFNLPAIKIAHLRPPLRLLGQDGRDLLGSPIDPGLEISSMQAIARSQAMKRPPVRMPGFVPSPAGGAGVRRSRARTHRPAVVIPVFNGAPALAACLEGVIANTPRDVPLIVVDDASSDAAVGALLRRLAADGSIRLVRHAKNRGFPAAANTGMRAAAGCDVVLLNSDVLTPAGWLDAVRGAAYAAADIGTASPLSNDATILTYPGCSPSAAPPDLAATTRIAVRAARAARHSDVIELPTTVGFCMYMRRDCLDDVGPFREDLFAQGYGEENDFCLRARHLGWRHVAALGTYVAHLGAASFGAAKPHLIKRNLAILERLHPGWRDMVDAHAAADPLFTARRRIDLLRWRDRFRRGARSAILVTHDDGGGVERVIRQRLHALEAEGLAPVILRPAGGQSVRIHPGLADDLPDLRFRMPDELAACASVLKSVRPQWIEYHHMLGQHPALLGLPAELDLPHRVMVHDYAWLCPRVTLVGGNGRYCGEPEARECDRCVADAGRMIEEEIDTPSLRRRSAAFLSAAERVTAPSCDARDRLRRHFPKVAVDVVAHENDGMIRPGPVQQSRSGLVVAVIGALGIDKGYNVLLACARDAADRKLDLRFVLVGHSIDDPRLLQTGRCFVTGPYGEGEAAALIEEAGARIGFIPSIWPETWCFALSEIWRAGLPAASFDIGAPAERIRATGAGIVLPLGLGASALNNALLATARRIGHV